MVKRLKGAQDDGQVPRVLGDLTAAKLTLFLQVLKVGPNHDQQLQDDGGRDVGHDAQGKNRQAGGGCRR